MAVSIHPTAIIGKQVQLGKDVSVGPYTVIDGKVEIGDYGSIAHNASIKGTTYIGANAKIHPFACIGEDPQDLKYQGEDSVLRIGSYAQIREFASINRGTEVGGGATTLGDHNLIMASCHIAHDCTLGDHTIMASFTALAGHVVVGDHCTFGGYSGVSQKIRVGSYTMTAGYANLRLDAAPFSIIAGNDHAKVVQLNKVRLERCDFTPEEISRLQKVFKIFFRSKLGTKQALEKILCEIPTSPSVEYFVQFIQSSKGVVR